MNTPMAEASPESSLESIEPGWILLRRIEEHPKQESLAHAIGVDAGTLSAFKNNKGALKISHLKALLNHLGLKLVRKGTKCIDEATLKELTQLAAKALRDAPQLLWEEDEE